jgi:DNA-binding NarL/FixJ family response regulator
VRDPTPVMIIGQPGRAHDGLRALLSAVSQVKIVGVGMDVRSASQNSAECQPALVLVDGDLLNGKAPEAIGQIRSRWPAARCLILASSVQTLLEARNAGADRVLVKGFSTTSFLESVLRLATQET